MGSISIKVDFSYDEIEAAFRKIEAEENLDLVIPVDLKSNQLGIMAEIFQLIITWSGYSDGQLFINLNSQASGIDDKIDLMFSKYYNFIAACMSYDKGIYTADKIDIRPRIARLLATKLKELSTNYSWKKGTQEFIVCVKHSASPLPFAFYSPLTRDLRSKQHFIEFTQKILASVAKNYKSNTDLTLLKRNKTLIGNIIFELIENTHKWALKDASEEEYFKAIRGLYVASHQGERKTLLNNCKDDKSLYDYINSDRFEGSNLQFIEISVFDSGPGLAGKWLGKKENELRSYNEIYEAILDCLILNNTSSRSNNYERGYGFFNILKVLKDIGYLKIKTNGLKLYRDFTRKPFIESSTDRDNYSLLDWNIKHDKPKEVSFYRGTLCSIIFPINSK